MGAFISKEVRPKHTKRDDTSDPLCPSGFTYIDESCPNNFPPAYDGCYAGLSGDPCTGNQFYESVPALTAAATSATTSSTQTPTKTTSTTTRTASAQTKTTSLTSSKTLSSSSILPAISSQTSSTTPSSQASSAAHSTSAHTPIPVASTSSVPVETVRPSPSSKSDTPAIAAGTVGAIAGAILALILLFVLFKRRKRRVGNEVLATQHDKDQRLQGVDMNGAENALKGTDGSESAPAYNSLWYPGTNNASNDGQAMYQRNHSHSAVSSLSPTQPGPEVPGSTPDPTGSQPELEVPAFHIPAELSPNSGRSLINSPRKTPSPSRVNSCGQGSLRQTADGSVMHPNMDPTGEDGGGGGAKNMGKSHVMSWMTYDDGDG